MLKECEREGVKIVFEKEFVGLEEDGGKVKLSFKDGDTVNVDVAVGADGLRSRVGEFVDKEAKAAYVGTMLIYGNIPAEKLDAQIAKTETKLSMPSMMFGKDGSFSIWPTDPDAQETGFFVNVVLPDRSREEWKKISDNKECLKKMLEKSFCHGAWHEQVQVMYREAPAEELTTWPMNMVPRLTSWSSASGKVILMGDAAHTITPSGGQGGAMAFEDAETLAYAISKFSDDANSLLKWEAH
jgi:2-polyprenyl-6-methoxyphenol hydroxylase-like FAD-dependent oxidoreductase